MCVSVTSILVFGLIMVRCGAQALAAEGEQEKTAQIIVPLWSEGTASAKADESPEIMEERGNEIAHDRRFRNINKPQLEVFAAKEPCGTGVLIIPGGGYWSVVMDKEGRDVALWFNSIGITAFVLKYRLPNTTLTRLGSEVPLKDAQLAMRLVRSRAAEFGIRPDRIGAIGFSAGGHLASTLGTCFDTGNSNAVVAIDRVSCRPDFLVLGYPVISMDEQITHAGSRSELLGTNALPEQVYRFSNELQTSANMPPVFIFCASDDKVVKPENSIRFYQAVRAVDVPAELHLFEWGGHGFSLRPGNHAAASWPGLCEAWLRERRLLDRKLANGQN